MLFIKTQALFSSIIHYGEEFEWALYNIEYPVNAPADSICGTLPFQEKFVMKSEDTLDWYPAQLPPVKIILGNAVLEVGKTGRPINTRTLLEYLQVTQKKLSGRDNKVAMQTAIEVLRDNQKVNGRL